MAASAGNKKRRRQLPCVLLCTLLPVALLVIGDAIVGAGACSPPTIRVLPQTEQLQGLPGSDEGAAGEGLPAALKNNDNKGQTTAAGAGGRRMLVGSRAPTCTYNECRGCRHRCSIQEVPIDASDPINSAYHYKCICHL